MATRLTRSRNGRVLAGVCAGLARHYGMSVTRLRVVFVLFGLIGAGELVYLALWILLPRDPQL